MKLPNLGLELDHEKGLNPTLGKLFLAFYKEWGLELPGYCLNPWNVNLFKIGALCLCLPCLPCLPCLLVLFWFVHMGEGEHWWTGELGSEGATVSFVILETRNVDWQIVRHTFASSIH